jgi:hypothetical protein
MGLNSDHLSRISQSVEVSVKLSACSRCTAPLMQENRPAVLPERINKLKKLRLLLLFSIHSTSECNRQYDSPFTATFTPWSVSILQLPYHSLIDEDNVPKIDRELVKSYVQV